MFEDFSTNTVNKILSSARCIVKGKVVCEKQGGM